MGLLSVVFGVLKLSRHFEVESEFIFWWLVPLGAVFDDGDDVVSDVPFEVAVMESALLGAGALSLDNILLLF